MAPISSTYSRPTPDPHNRNASTSSDTMALQELYTELWQLIDTAFQPIWAIQQPEEMKPPDSNCSLLETSPRNPDEVDEMISFLRFTNVSPNLPLSPWSATVIAAPQPRPSRVNFMDLPVEIRCEIYRLVFPKQTRYRCKRLGPCNLPAPCPPAITRASGQIRIESFETWCSTVRLPIRFRATSWPGPMGLHGTPTYKLVCTAHESVFPFVRKLQLCFDNGSNDFLCTSIGWFCFTIDLDKNSNTYSVEHAPQVQPAWPNSEPLYESVNADTLRRIDRLLSHFDKAMAEILVNSGGVGNITLEHYQHLVPQHSWRVWYDLPEEEED